MSERVGRVVLASLEPGALPKHKAVCPPSPLTGARKPDVTGRENCLHVVGVAVISHPVFEILWFTCKKHYDR